MAEPDHAHDRPPQGSGLPRLPEARSGKWDINGRTLGDYFPRPALVTAIQQPFTATDMLGRYRCEGERHGGGQTGQAGALASPWRVPS
jgi:ribosomal protein S9